MSKKEFTEMQNGTTSGTDIDFVDETLASGVETNCITVYTHTNERIKIPAKSTVLDFAFRLHKDIGFSCKFAYINGSPQRAPIYTRLNDGDKIEVVCELDENNLNKNIAELRWLAYCKNENTQRILSSLRNSLGCNKSRIWHSSRNSQSRNIKINLGLLDDLLFSSVAQSYLTTTPQTAA